MSLGDGIPSLWMETRSWFSKHMCSWDSRNELPLHARHVLHSTLGSTVLPLRALRALAALL